MTYTNEYDEEFEDTPENREKMLEKQAKISKEIHNELLLQNFKVGDKVVFVRGEYKGKKGTIKSVKNKNGLIWIIVKMKGNFIRSGPFGNDLKNINGKDEKDYAIKYYAEHYDSPIADFKGFSKLLYDMTGIKTTKKKVASLLKYI